MRMATKSINLRREDAVGLSVIIEKDPRVERGASEALRYCFEDAARDIPDWNKVREDAKGLDYEIKIPENDIGVTRTFLVEDEVYLKVFKSVVEQLNMKKPQVSFLTRLCIYAARLRLESKNFNKKKIEVTIEKVDGVELLRRVNEKAAKLIQAGEVEVINKFLEV